MSLLTQEQFTKIWTRKRWASQDGYPLSGKGSTLDYTANVRTQLPRIIARHGITSILDAPCGDWTWMREVDLGGVRYIGADIVPELVAGLQADYPGRDFRLIDLTEAKLPPCDLWLCRFCLNHLSSQDINRVFRRLKVARIKFVMVTSHPGAVYHSVKTGGFRQIDVQAWPFGFGRAIETIEDWTDGFPRCQLLMFRLSDIRARLRVQ